MQRREFLQSLMAASLAGIPASGKRTKVIVIGAGLSGMVAAKERLAASYEVTRNRRAIPG